MTQNLRIAPHLTLPLDTVTQSLAILARKRAGKSYTARRFAEELLSAGQQVVILDPKGDWWGIRSGADGKTPGYPVVILGGEHGDLALEKTAAETIAHLIVEERVSVLLDLSDFGQQELATFLGGRGDRHGAGIPGLLELIYRWKAKESFRTPVMIVTDEADAIAPQKPAPGEERMLRAMNDIVRRGGQRGIGCLLITQRSAVVNKDVLTQTQVMIAMRTIAKLDMDAIMDWVNVHGNPDQAKILKASLPALPVGDAWILSPGWPTEEGIFERVHVDRIGTFDSFATPKAGEKRIQPKNLADVDLDALERRMAATIERAKASDPVELAKQLAVARKRIAELEKKPAVSNDTGTGMKLNNEAHYKRGYEAAQKRLSGVYGKLKKNVLDSIGLVQHQGERQRKELLALEERIHAAAFSQLALGEIRTVVDAIFAAYASELPDKIPDNSAKPQNFTDHTKLSSEAARSVVREQRTAVSSVETPEGELVLNRLHRAILTVLAQHDKGLSKGLISLHSGYRASGDVSTAFASLTRQGLVAPGGPGLAITSAGLTALGDYDPLPVGSALRDWLLEGDKLTKVEKALLSVIHRAGPEGLPKGEIVQKAGYKPSGDVSTAFARLVRFGYAVPAGRGLQLAKELTDLYETA